MIKDKLDNFGTYLEINYNFVNVHKYLKYTDFSLLANGKYFLDGEDLFAIVSSYSTKSSDEGIWEAHRKYIDVQYVFEGNEKIGVCDIDKLEIKQDYNIDQDVVLGQARGDLITLNKGDFMILFPQDAHQPGISVDFTKQNIKKIVVKVKV